MMIAITREVSRKIGDCELTHLSREPIDFRLACEQHRAYEKALEELGCDLHRLPEEIDLPDSVFVEDAAIVVDELAVITRPGAESRRAETISIADALAAYRELQFIEAPATLDGGDVLLIGKTLFVGLSSRSNQQVIEQLRSFLLPYGYEVRGVEVRRCLHLKSAVTQISDGLLLINPAFIDAEAFNGYEWIEVDESEPYAANALRIKDAIIYPANYPRTLTRLETRRLAIQVVDVSELIKAEGAVTCCSLVFSG
jgi:dimethylargininase